jgi:hypothetical protein
MITLKPYGGLANRLRVIDSALALANDYNHSLRVIWEKSFEINCEFYKIISPGPEFEIIETRANAVRKRINNRLPRLMHKIGIKYPFGYNNVLLTNDIQIIKDQGNDFSFCASSEKIYIANIHFFYRSTDYYWLKPSPAIEDKARKYTGMFPKNSIGIHIRRTDNIESIRHSPLELFIEKMQIELDKNPHSAFFLATDSKSDEKKLKEIFGKKIMSCPKVLDRNSEQGIFDAMVDLYCLASTKKIIGSYFSSFSELAAQINKIELQLIYK